MAKRICFFLLSLIIITLNITQCYADDAPSDNSYSTYSSLLSIDIEQTTVNAGELIVAHYSVFASDITILGINWASRGWRSLPCPITDEHSVSYKTTENGDIWLEITVQQQNGTITTVTSEIVHVINGLSVDLNVSGIVNGDSIYAGDTITVEYSITGASGNYSVEFWWDIEIEDGSHFNIEKVTTSNAYRTFSYTVTNQAKSIGFTIFVFDKNGCSYGGGKEYSVLNGGIIPIKPQSGPTIELNSSQFGAGENIIATISNYTDFTILAANWCSRGWKSLPLDLSYLPEISFTEYEDCNMWLEIVYSDANGYIFSEKSEEIRVLGISIAIDTKINTTDEGIGQSITINYHIEGGTPPYRVRTNWSIKTQNINSDILFQESSLPDGFISYIPTPDIEELNYTIWVVDSINAVASCCEPYPYKIADNMIQGVVTYTWSTDNDVITASDGRIEETVPVHKHISSPTLFERGKITYLGDAFENSSFNRQMRIIELPALSDMNVLFLPDNLLSIEDEAFTNLPCEAIIVPKTCVSIGKHAFANCSNLVYVCMSKETSFEENTFEGCENAVIDAQ